MENIKLCDFSLKNHKQREISDGRLIKLSSSISAKMGIFPGMYFTARYQKLFPYEILLWKEPIKVVWYSTTLAESVISFSSREFKEISASFQLKTPILSIIPTCTYKRCFVRYPCLYLHCVSAHQASTHSSGLRHCEAGQRMEPTAEVNALSEIKWCRFFVAPALRLGALILDLPEPFSPISEPTVSESWPNEVFIILSFLLILLLKSFKHCYHSPQDTCLLQSEVREWVSYLNPGAAGNILLPLLLICYSLSAPSSSLWL